MNYNLNDFIEGKKLFGDDFSYQQIVKWYEEESEAYANLGSKNHQTYSYDYHEINKIYGFNKLKNINFENVLGFGSAWGYEFEPILDKISKITIIEPSDNLRSAKIGNIVPEYIKPTVTGKLSFDDNTFDLVTCFGTLHHIPNVNFVLEELIRIVKPGGHLLIREPIISMGDWTKKRIGLTINERGIPVSYFDSVFKNHQVKVVSKKYCFTMTSLIQRFCSRWIKKPIYSYQLYVYADKLFSAILKSNVHYHAQHKIQRIAPSSIFYVVKKPTIT